MSKRVLKKSSLPSSAATRPRGSSKKPEICNFHTPNNDLFYSTSPYRVLSRARREIRLLRVLPPKPYAEHLEDNPQWTQQFDKATIAKMAGIASDAGISMKETPILACELMDQVPTSSVNAAYCTVSYCAGSPQHTALMIVDGLPFHAFANLEHAITNALWCWKSRYPGQDLLLWADQICINQQDHAERAHQVTVMREIYRRCHETFICLSTPESGDVLAWARSQKGPGNSPDLKANFIHWVERRLSELARPKPEPEGQLVPRTRGGPGRRSEPALPSDHNVLQDFMQCPWWRRCWVFQEFLCSPNPIFLSNENFMGWKSLSAAVDFVTAGWALVRPVVQEAVLATEVNTKMHAFLPTSSKSSVIRRPQSTKEECQKKEYQRIEKFIELASKRYKDVRAAEVAEGRRDTREWYSREYNHIPNPIPWTCILTKFIPTPKPLLKFSIGPTELEVDCTKEDLKGSNFDAHGLRRHLRQHGDDSNLFWPSDKLLAASKAIDTWTEGLEQAFSNPSESVVSMVRAKRAHKRWHTLESVLQHSRHSDASDSRDRVYAFLGLVPDGYGLAPSYEWSNTIHHVLIDVAMAMVSREKNLHMLRNVGRGRNLLGHSLPSWVPDWTSREVLDPVWAARPRRLTPTGPGQPTRGSSRIPRTRVVLG